LKILLAERYCYNRITIVTFGMIKMQFPIILFLIIGQINALTQNQVENWSRIIVKHELDQYNFDQVFTDLMASKRTDDLISAYLDATVPRHIEIYLIKHLHERIAEELARSLPQIIKQSNDFREIFYVNSQRLSDDLTRSSNQLMVKSQLIIEQLNTRVIQIIRDITTDALHHNMTIQHLEASDQRVERWFAESLANQSTALTRLTTGAVDQLNHRVEQSIVSATARIVQTNENDRKRINVLTQMVENLEIKIINASNTIRTVDIFLSFIIIVFVGRKMFEFCL
jgi:hypothetical protein